MAVAPSEVAASETLARDMSSRSGWRRAKARQAGLYREFLPKPGDDKVSVDRLTEAGSQRARELAEERAKLSGRTHYGWSVLAAEAASRRGRTVIASPTTEPDNPYHAEIVLPTDDPEEQKEHAHDLAMNSVWVPAS